MLSQRDGFIQQRLVFHNPTGLDAARCTDNRFGRRIIEPHRKLVRCKATEHNRVDCPEPGTGKHCDHCFGNHRHINNDPVALTDAASGQHARKGRDRVTQFAESETLPDLGHG